MKRTIPLAMIITLGLALSGASHALLIMMPNGTKMEAQIVGNKLMLLDPGGKSSPARDGIYKTDDGKPLNVQGGVLTAQGGAKESSDAKNKGEAVGPMYNTPGSPGVPASGSTPTAPAPNRPPPVVTDGKFVQCPLKQARTEVVSKLPKGWWQTPYEGPLVGTRVETIGGEKTLVCEYQAYTTRASVMTKVPMSVNCVAVSEGFNCR